MRYLICFFILISCGTSKPVVKPPIVIYHPPNPEPFIVDTIHETFIDSVHISIRDTTAKPYLSITDFGAQAAVNYDNAEAIQKAVDWVIQHPQPLVIPIGEFFSSRSILAQNAGRFFTLHLTGILPSKSSSKEYVSQITFNTRSGFGIGIQLGRNIVIENLSIIGQYTFPSRVTNANIGTLKFSDWQDGSVVDSRYDPYAGISIDPRSNADGSTGGTSSVEIRNCSIRQWMVGVMLTANQSTLNDEMINLIDDDIESCRVAVAIGQDQSKEIHIDRLKCWGQTHTLIDGVTYGRGTGGGSVMIDGANIAGCVNQLFNIVNDRFPLSCMNIYAESVFRIGRFGGSAGANLINCDINFLSGPGWPEADYLIEGGGNFFGGQLRYYDQSSTHRLNLVNTYSMFRDMVLSSIPIVEGLYGAPANVYAEPRYDNCHNYVSGKSVYYDADTLIKIPSPGPMIIIDRVKWIATMTHIPADLKIGDYILGSPNGKYYDQAMNSSRCPTAQIGRVVAISAGLATLDCVAVNCYTDTPYDGVYISRLK